MAIADVAARFVPLPVDRRVMRLGVAPGGMNEGRVPAPAIGSGDPDTLSQKMQRRLGAHAAARGDIVGASVSQASAGIDDDDVERLQRIADALELLVAAAAT